MTRLRGALAAAAAVIWTGAANAQTAEAPPDTPAVTAPAGDGLGVAAEAEAPAEIARPAEPTAAPTISDAIAGGRFLFEVRARYEFVDQKRTAVLTENGEAFTARTRLGWETADWNGFKAL